MSTVNGPFRNPPVIGAHPAELDIALPVSQTRDDTLLGASEAAAVLGLDRYRSPMSVWLAKRAARAGEPPPVDEKPDFVKEAAEWGVALEPVVRGKYALETNQHVFVPTDSVRSALEHDKGGYFLRCTPDGFTCPSGTEPPRSVECRDPIEYPTYRRRRNEGLAGLLQVKTCSAYKGDEWADGPPPAYEVQCRVEMAVCDLPWCDLVCLIGGQRYVKHRIERDAKLEQNILADLRAFWQHVLDGTPPPIDDSPAWTEYASSKMAYTKVVLPADDEIRALLVEWRQVKAQRKEAERLEGGIKNQLLLRLSAAGASVVDGGDLGKCSAFPNPARMDYKKAYETLKLWLTTPYQAPPDIPLVDGVMRTSPPYIESLELRCRTPGKGYQIRTPKSWGEEE